MHRVFLHVGTPKSGTTYLQEVLWRNRDSLRADGVRYPGARPDEQFLATLDLLERDFHGVSDPAVRDAWERISTEARAWHGTSVISHEMLAPATPEMVRRAMNSFGNAEVHVVCTARDLARQLPAVWQEDVKNSGQLTFDEFSRSLRGDTTVNPYFANTFWGYQDIPAFLRTWAADLPPERVHVITLPRGAARDTLWRRFAEVVGVDPVRPVEVDVRNPSTGVVETNLLRLLNRAGVREDLGWPGYENLVKEFLALEVLAGRPGSVPLTLPVEDRPWVEQWCKDTVEAIRAAGYHVVGDLGDLLPTWRVDHDTGHPDSATDAELLDAAVYALASTLRLVQTERRRAAARKPPPPASVRGVLLERYEGDPRMRWMLRGYRNAKAAVRAIRNGR
ncbi:hypothetical protein [Actinophytocola gossypii]|uniref:Sulfotransferase family protein n=1 Tax=Actinophytocola gossypii TaxID=2812003 RepID=A0ABT2JCB4_9PSEU|nr:hypothetical protein [Actinophytocola gossypii]MCT2585508.1 hypothetical protein [Actinophytocola gossypii]